MSHKPHRHPLTFGGLEWVGGRRVKDGALSDLLVSWQCRMAFSSTANRSANRSSWRSAWNREITEQSLVDPLHSPSILKKMLKSQCKLTNWSLSKWSQHTPLTERRIDSHVTSHIWTSHTLNWICHDRVFSWGIQYLDPLSLFHPQPRL